MLARKCTGDVAETRNYVWFYALAYDFAYAGTSASDRQAVKNVMLSCGNAGLVKVADSVRLYPENGIAFNTLGKFVGALLIVRGDMPEMTPRLRSALPTYVASVSAWAAATTALPMAPPMPNRTRTNRCSCGTWSSACWACRFTASHG